MTLTHDPPRHIPALRGKPIFAADTFLPTIHASQSATPLSSEWRRAWLLRPLSPSPLTR